MSRRHSPEQVIRRRLLKRGGSPNSLHMEAVLARHEAGMSQKQIAAELKISPSTVNMCLSVHGLIKPRSPRVLMTAADIGLAGA